MNIRSFWVFFFALSVEQSIDCANTEFCIPFTADAIWIDSNLNLSILFFCASSTRSCAWMFTHRFLSETKLVFPYKSPAQSKMSTIQYCCSCELRCSCWLVSLHFVVDCIGSTYVLIIHISKSRKLLWLCFLCVSFVVSKSPAKYRFICIK